MRDKLEAAIEANPDDDANYIVYGDWLQSQGDPLGELIALHAANKPDEAAAFIAAHDLLGPFADLTAMSVQRLALEWHLGFVKSVDIGWQIRHGKKTRDAKQTAEDLTALLALPVMRFVQKLSLGPVPPSDYLSFDRHCEALATGAKPQTLRELVIGDIAHWDISSTSAGPFAPILNAFPKLQRLTIHAGEITIGAFDQHDELRELAVETGGDGDFAALDGAKLPKLEELELWFGTPRFGGAIDLSNVQMLLTGVNVPKLRHLGLMNAAFTDDIVEALVDAPILKQLASLDLSMGTLSDAGVQIMVAHKQRFVHLEHLNLDDNAMTEASQPLVAGLAKHVEFGSQDPDRIDCEDLDDRYTAVGE